MLPGMDGTGDLFSEFVSILPFETEVICFPDSGAQDYENLADVVGSKIQHDKFILLAESFSGGLVTRLIEQHGDKIIGVIFVASFISSPNKLMLLIARLLPIKLLAQMPFSNFAIKRLFLGQGADAGLLNKFKSIIRSVPSRVLKARLKAMQVMLAKSQVSFDIPCAYIQASKDLLVPNNKSKEISCLFTRYLKIVVNGPHFILQANPLESKQAIEEAVQYITKPSS